MASGIAGERVRTTATAATVESRKMVAILQIRDWQRHAALVFLVLIVDAVRSASYYAIASVR